MGRFIMSDKDGTHDITEVRLLEVSFVEEPLHEFMSVHLLDVTDDDVRTTLEGSKGLGSECEEDPDTFGGL